MRCEDPKCKGWSVAVASKACKLAHVAGVKAVVCHSVLGLCGCVYCKNRDQKHLKSKMQELRTRFVAFDVNAMHLFEYPSARYWSKDINRTSTRGQKN